MTRNRNSSNRLSTARFDTVERRRVRRWLIVLGLVAGLSVLAFAVWIVWFSAWLAVDHVDVSGQTSLKADTVKETADVPEGAPLARVDTTAIEARVSSIARVENVTVSRGWPHTIRINVTERTPVAWMKVDRQIRAIDRHGVDYRELSKAPEDLIEIQAPAGEDQHDTIQACARVIQNLTKHDPDFMGQITSIRAESPDSLEFTIGKGRSVRWGSPGEMQEKLRVLGILLDTVDAGHYDVSAPARPTTRK